MREKRARESGSRWESENPRESLEVRGREHLRPRADEQPCFAGGDAFLTCQRTGGGGVASSTQK